MTDKKTYKIFDKHTGQFADAMDLQLSPKDFGCKNWEEFFPVWDNKQLLIFLESCKKEEHYELCVIIAKILKKRGVEPNKQQSPKDYLESFWVALKIHEEL